MSYVYVVVGNCGDAEIFVKNKTNFFYFHCHFE